MKRYSRHLVFVLPAIVWGASLGNSTAKAQKISEPIVGNPSAVRSLEGESALGRAKLDVQLRAAGDQGVTVVAVRPEGAADQAGLQQGDVIREIDGKQVSAPRDVATMLKNNSPGDRVTLKYTRAGVEETKQVTLSAGSRARNPVGQNSRSSSTEAVPSRSAARSARTSEGEEPADSELSGDRPRQNANGEQSNNAQPIAIRGGWLGVAVEPGDSELNGLKVTRVYPGGPAARAGISEGTILLAVDGHPLREHQDLAKALESTHAGDSVTVRLTRGPNPQLQQKEKTVRLGESRMHTMRPIDENDPHRDSSNYWEDGQGFATQIPAQTYEIEYKRRLAEQNERLERLLISLREDVRQLREEVTALKDSQQAAE